MLAEIGRVRGTRGEVIARSQTDVPGRLEQLKNAWLALPDGSDFEVKIEAAWQHKSDWVLKFHAIDSIEAAERLRGADLWVPLTERGNLAAGEFFQSDLMGCAVIDTGSGKSAGIVAGWQQYGGPPLMEVRNGEEESLIPFVAHLCEIDLDAKTIRVELPQGLLEL